MNRKSKINTNVLVKAAFLIALSIVLTRGLSIMLPIGGAETIRVGFGVVPVFMSGILFGPTVGGLTGLAADLIGFLINPMGGAFHPGITFTKFLEGFIPGIFGNYFRKRLGNDSYIKYHKILMAQVISSIITSLILMPIWLIGLYGKESVVLSYPFRIINTMVNIGIHSVIVFNILKLFKNEIKGV